MPKGELTLRLTLAKPGFTFGPPPRLCLGLAELSYHPLGLTETKRVHQADALAREASARAMLAIASQELAAANAMIAELSRQLPGAAEAAGQRDSAPGGVVPSASPVQTPANQLDAAPGGGPHFAGRE